MNKNMATVLLLEDEPLIAMDLELTLETAGFQVTTVLSCTDALKSLDTVEPDVVIVDIILRDGPSNAVVERLIDRDIPFLVHSGDVAAMHKGTPFARGLWVGKPAAAGELAEAAMSLVRR